MRVLGAMLVLLSTLAIAGWREVGTILPPVSDVQLVDAGVVLVTSSTSGAIALQVTDAGVTTLNSLVGVFVGSGYFGANCLVGLTGLGVVSASPGCGTATPLGAGSWRSFRMISSAPLGIAVVTNTSSDTLWAGPGAGPGWAPVGAAAASVASRSLQTARIGGIDYAAVNSGSGLRVSVDAGIPPAVAIAGTIGWRDAVPFSLAGAPAILGATSSSLQLIRDYRTPVVFTPSIPVGLSPRSVGIGGANAMVTTATGVVLSPIPDPSRFAETWVARAAPPGLDRINCSDDRYCAAVTDAGTIWFFENAVAPGVAVAAATVDVGQTIRLVADAGDGDGDPVFVTWSSDAGVLTAVTADGTQLDFTAPANGCVPLMLDLTVSDGLLAHDRTLQVPVTVIARGALQTNVSARVAAGDPAVTFNAFIDGGCAPATIGWATSDGQLGSGSTFNWTPPVTECNADGGQRTITVTATWASASPPTTSVEGVVAITPWGAPNAPVFMSPASQPSGSQVDYAATDVEHVCSTSSDFPGTILEWTIDAGATRVVEFDGGLTVIAANCTVARTRVTASAVRRVWGDLSGRASNAGTLQVDVEPIAPLDATTGFFVSVQGDAGVLFGVLKADAGCLDERGVSARVTVSSAGAPVAQGDFALKDGGWSLPIPGGCAGGTYDVVAQLLEGGASDQGSITLPFTPAGIGALSTDRIDVTCGAGARASVSLLPEPNTCGASSFSWRTVSGPALSVTSGTGDALELQSEALDFSVVGDRIELEWTANAGAGNSVSAARRIELGVLPFLEVSVKTRPPLRREEEAVTLDVLLRNTTECAVDAVSVALPFTGGTPILESILVDGARAAVRSTDDGLIVDGVSVPASGIATIRLSVRPGLLSSPSVQPVASLRGYVVSTQPPLVTPSTGCGCAQVDVSALLLAMLVACRRRRLAR